MSADNHSGFSGSPEAFWDEAEALGRAAAAQLEYFEALGVTELPIPLPPPAAARPGTSAAAPAKPAPRKAPSSSRPVPPRPEASAPAEAEAPATWAAASPSLADLDLRTGRCRACHLAPEPPARPLFGRGSAKPLIVFVGPDPTIYEGGKAELLSGIIEKGLKLAPPEYYITTLTRCPLPDDGDTAAEKKAIAACGPILDRELALLRPKVVLAMGSRAGRFLSGSSDPVGLLRSKTRVIDGLEGTWLRITFGLSHMLTSPEIKKEGWKDIQKIIPGLDKLKGIS